MDELGSLEVEGGFLYHVDKRVRSSNPCHFELLVVFFKVREKAREKRGRGELEMVKIKY